MKRVLLYGLGFVTVIIIALTIAISQIDAEFIIKKIADVTEQTTGSALLCDQKPEISIFPLGLTFGKARWGEISQNKGMRASIKSGLVALEIIPLLSGNIVIKEIRLDNPVLEIRQEKSASGQHNSADATLNPTSKTDAIQVSPDTTPNFPADLPIELERLVLRQGEIIFTEVQESQVKLKNINILIENLRRREEARIQCDFAFDLIRNKNDTFSGTLALDTKLRYETAILKLQQTSVTFTPVDSRFPKDIEPVQFFADSILDLQKQNLRLTDLRLNLPYNVKIQADLEILLKQHLSLVGKIQTSQIPLDRYQAFLDKISSPKEKEKKSASNKDSANNSKADQISPAKEDPSWPTIDLHISVAGIRLDKLLLNDIAAAIKGEDGKYVLSSLNCILGSGGVINGQASANISDKIYSTKIIARGVNIGGLAEALHKGRPAEGIADLNSNLNLRGNSAKDFKTSLNGDGTLEARDVRAAALSSTLHSVPGLSSLSDNFQLVRIPFTIRNGEITAQPITLTSKDINAKGRALASLSKEFLDLTATIQALGINIPIYAKGPFDNLSYGLDAKFSLPSLKNAAGAASDAGKSVGDSIKKGSQGTGNLVKGLFRK